MAPEYSDLEVSQKHPSPAPGLEYDYYKSDQTSEKEVGRPLLPEPSRQRICGLSPKWFWVTIVAIVFIIVAGAVGGGVGGSMSKSNKSNTIDKPEAVTTTSSSLSSISSVGQSQSLVSSSSTTPSATVPPAISTTQIIGPGYTLTRDCPSSNNSLYSVTLGTSQMAFRKVCGATFLNTLEGGFGNVVSKKTGSLDSCINLCAAYNVENATAIASGTNSVCNAVCWRNSLHNDDWPSQCFGFTTQNSSNAMIVYQDLRCDSATWINQKFGA